MSRIFERMRKSVRLHRWGLLAVLCGILLSLPGLHWGKFECWNLDQLAHQQLQENGLPRDYLKPPLLTYLHQVLLLPAVTTFIDKRFSIRPSQQGPQRLLASRLLTVAMFAASVWFVYLAGTRAAGRGTAAALALLYATSAGVLVFNRFLTTDSPLLFWMSASLLAGLVATEKKSIAWAVFAGVLAGLATANKYNGLWAGAALPAALLAALGWRAFLWPGFWLGGLAVPLGFALGNPGAVVETQRFVADFLYNLQITPVYHGEAAGWGYLRFWERMPALLGWPGVFALVISLGLTAWLFVRRQIPRSAWPLLAACLGVIFFYYLSIGKFPRTETRFVLPLVPFLLLLVVPAWEALRRWMPRAAPALLGLILLYNVAASLEVGDRFLRDPRMAAVEWVKENIPASATIENSYAPHWRRIPYYRPTIRQMPAVTGRAQRFAALFPDDPALQANLERYETPPEAVALFTPEALAERNPDFIAFSHFVFIWTGDDAVREFYQKLAREELGYRIVFHQTHRPPPFWTYPHDIDFLAESFYILARKTESNPAPQ
jgi:MFS family permease